jgi:hypothetical protein
MRQSLKISLSLLISILIFSVFAIVSFTGFFTVIETSFFQPRITERIEQQLLTYTDQTNAYHRLNVERFSGLMSKGFVWTAFARDQSPYQQEIKDRENEIGKIFEAYPSLQLVRFIGPEGRNIHYSTAEQDIISRSPLLKYRPLEVGDYPGGVASDLVTPRGTPPRVILDGENDRFIYSFPVVDGGQDRYLGSALFYLSKTELINRLVTVPGLDFRELFLISSEGIVINFPVERKELIAASVAEIWTRQRGAELFSEILSIYDQENAKINYRLLGRDDGEYGFITLFVPLSVFQLQPFMQVLILASFFLTVFLIVFLIFNLKQDPILVLTQRIKRFQLQILQEYMEGKDRVDWERWRRELTASRAELKTRIKKGIGKIAAGREPELDGMIDKSWDEIIAVIGARGSEPQPQQPDIARVEELIQKALDRGRITLPAREVREVHPVLPREEAAVAAPKARKSIVVEEIGVDEVLESGEEVEELEAAEAVPEGEPEAVEELEELEAAEAVPEGEPEAVEELEEPEAAEAVPEGEPEAVEELEELEAAEAVPEGEPEAVEELEEPEAAGAVPEGEPEAVEELEEPEAAGAVPEGEPEAVEELEEPEAAEELEEPEAAGAVPEGELEAVEELEEPEAAEELEELEVVPEIKTLPPEPQEELDMLPLAEEEEAAGPPVEPAPVGEDLAAEVTPEPAGAPARPPEPGGERESIQRQLDALLAQGKIRICTIAVLAEAVKKQRTAVVVEDGVYRISEEIYTKEKPSGGLMALAKSLRSEAGEAVPVGAEILETGLAGAGTERPEETDIGELLGLGDNLDLLTEISELPEWDAAQKILMSRRTRHRLELTENGLDYQGYLAQFGSLEKETGKLRSLVELSSKIKAMSAAILVKSGELFAPSLKIGLIDKPEKLRFSAAEAFYRTFLAERKIVLINEQLESVKALASKFNAEDLQYLRGAIFIPAVYEDKEALLFLGMPLKKEHDLKELVSSLNIFERKT